MSDIRSDSEIDADLEIALAPGFVGSVNRVGARNRLIADVACLRREVADLRASTKRPNWRRHIDLANIAAFLLVGGLIAAELGAWLNHYVAAGGLGAMAAGVVVIFADLVKPLDRRDP